MSIETETPETLPALPHWQMGSGLRANELNTLSNWQRWLYNAANGLPASTLLRPAYRWELVRTGIVTRYYGELSLIHQHRYLIYRGWHPYDESSEGSKIKSVLGWVPENEASLADAAWGWTTCDLTQYDWLFVGTPYIVSGCKYAMESDVPYEF